jgi:hypothetical protein
MKRFFGSFVLLVLLAAVLLSGCTVNRLEMKNVNLISPDLSKKAEMRMLIQPHQSLGLEPTPAIRNGNISTFLVVFPKRLFGEYFPGRLRWNTWTVLENETEAFGQIIFSGMHPLGDYFGTEVIDGRVNSGQTAILSSALDYIYSPFGKELPVDQGKFLTDPKYRYEKIREVNKDKNGNVFNLNSLSRIDGFQQVIKNWNQIQYPEGYLLSPYGVEGVAAIRGINPQYSYFQKLVGTGRFAIRPTPDPVSFAIINSIGILMDMLAAGSAPSKGWDYMSQLPSRRDMSFTIEYLLRLAEVEIKKRNQVNQQLIQAQGAPRR